MNKIYIPALVILAFLFGCNKSTSDAPPARVGSTIEKCPIHHVALSKDLGKLPDGMTVSWTKKMYVAMEKNPYVRHNRWNSKTVQYCVSCEIEVDKVMESEKRTLNQQLELTVPSEAPRRAEGLRKIISKGNSAECTIHTLVDPVKQTLLR